VGKLELELLPTENCQPSYELGDLMASFIDREVDMVIVTKGGALHNRAVGVAMFRDVMGCDGRHCRERNGLRAVRGIMYGL